MNKKGGLLKSHALKLKMNKKGGLLDKETVEIILAVAAGILIILLIFNLLSADYNKEDETSKSFFNNLEKQLKIADGGNIGEFLMWDLDRNDDVEYNLVYFGERITYEGFESKENNKNHVCICSSKEDVNFCNSCKNLDNPIKIKESGEENFIIKSDEKIAIEKKDGYYEFTRVG